MLIHRGGITDEESITDRALPELSVRRELMHSFARNS